MRFLGENKAFLALLIPFITIPWIRIGDFHLLLFNFPHNRLEMLGFATEMSTYALIGALAVLAIGIALIFALTLSRFYCGTLCPNTFFAHILTLFKRRSFLSKFVGFLLLSILSFALAFSGVAYGIDSVELINAIEDLTFAGWMVIVLGILMIAEVYMVQGWYCAYLCPYGATCAILPIEDRLTYEYSDPQNNCTECGGCVKICPIPGLDIREGFDLRCIQCGLCEAACKKTFAKSPIRSLIHRDNRTLLRAEGRGGGFLIASITLLLLVLGGMIFLSDTERLDSCRLENKFLH